MSADLARRLALRAADLAPGPDRQLLLEAARALSGRPAVVSREVDDETLAAGASPYVAVGRRSTAPSAVAARGARGPPSTAGRSRPRRSAGAR
jgi:hypothetical protein